MNIVKLSLLASFLFTSVSFAAECPYKMGEDFSAKLVAGIQATKTCYDAAKLAYDCAQGSTMDLAPMGEATDKCSKSFASNAGDKDLFSKMADRCNKAYGAMEGTMWRAVNAGCRLDAAKWLSGVNAAGNE